MNASATLSISKLDAARRQLEVAIRLYFSDDDPVSTYTLAAAAMTVLRDLAAAMGHAVVTFEQGLIARAVPGKEKELITALRRHQNFFKHADKDPDAAIDFNPESTQWLLIDAALSYAQLTGETTPVMGALNFWWQYQNRGLIKAEHSQVREQLEAHAEWFKVGKRGFLAKVLPILSATNAR